MQSIGKRIGISYLLMATLLAAIGSAGWFATDRLSQILDHVTGPVQGTTRAVDSGIRGVLLQMTGVDMALDGRADEAQRQIAAGSALATAAFDVIDGARLITGELLTQVKEKMAEFNANRTKLLELHDAYVAHYQQLLKNTESTKDLLLMIEEQASQALVNLEWNAGLAEDESSNARDSEEWAVVGSAADARLALVTRLFDFRQLLERPDDPARREAAAASLGDLLIYTEQLAESELLHEKLIERGRFGKLTFDVALTQLYKDNARLFAEALATHAQLRESQKNYATVAAALMEDASRIEKESQRIIEEQLDEAASSRNSAVWLVTGLITLGLTIAFAAYLISIRTIARPLRTVAQRLQQIASGDGDLTARLEVNGSDEIADVSRSFNEFADKIRQTIIEVRRAVAQLTESSDQMHRMTETSTTRSRRQQDETAQIATATQQMSHTVSSVAESAQGALDSANVANSEAAQGRQVVTQTLTAINGLGEQVDLADRTIQALGQESESIGSVIDVIGSIAEQTNLLALNAAIEAARAGDQGRGFSVVADEVRTLANRTQQSTSEILEMIERLQVQARQAARAMQESRTMAHDTIEHGEKTSASLQNIVDSVGVIQGINQHIASAAAEQRSAAESISESVDRINCDGEEIVDDSHKMSASAKSLSAVAENLEALVSQFRT